jgi:hypothetical protein
MATTQGNSVIMKNKEGFAILEHWRTRRISLFLMRNGRDIAASGPVQVVGLDRRCNKMELDSGSYQHESVDLIGASMLKLPAPQTEVVERSPYNQFLQINFADKSEWLLAGRA